MRVLRFACLLCAGLLAADVGPGPKVALQIAAPQEPAPESVEEKANVNVNSRYWVESIDVQGGGDRKLSPELQQEIQQRIGEKFNQDAMDSLGGRIRKELRARSVIQKVLRGRESEHVKVIFEVVTRDEKATEYDLTKFVYHSKQAWSAKLFGDVDLGPHSALLLGIASDADDLLERYAGVGAGFEVRKVGSERVRLGFLFESYHHQWNRATLQALEGSEAPGVYRTRNSFQPALTVAPAESLTISVGTAFHRIQTQYPTLRTQAANAVVAAIRYRQRFHNQEHGKHEVRAGYEVRAANRSLDSDFVYTRHQWSAGYKIGGGGQTVVDTFTAGRMSGRAPLFERYSLGNSTTLRGWDKFQVAPVGGDRVVHNSLEYRHRIDGGTSLIAFYDVGAVWNRGTAAEAKHAVGFGLRSWRFQTALAFPVRSGRMEPMFMAGVYFTEGADF